MSALLEWSIPPDAQHGPSLADALDALYRRTRARMGAQDLEHIRRVAAYSAAIEARATELITRGRTPRQVWRGAVLRGLHTVLEFSELGHAILHGSYDGLDALDPGGPFHSERWRWDFVADEREWRVMHHQNHHPLTNIVGRDHDLGYSAARWMPGQDWYAHHALQPALLALLVVQAYPFALYTAMSAAAVEGRPLTSRDSLAAARQRVADHLRRRYVDEPRQAGWRALQTLLGNYAGSVIGYDFMIFMLGIEHHGADVELVADPGPDESRDAYFARQFRTTTNFRGDGRVQRHLERLLAEEVPFNDRPDFRVFYGGLDTHVEHHLFPDLPCARLRELQPEVRRLAARHGVPYHERPLAPQVGQLLARFVTLAAPVGEGERLRDLVRHPRRLARRLRDGFRYRGGAADTHEPYLAEPRLRDVDASVLRADVLASGDAVALELARPRSWRDVSWPAGANVSVQVEVDGERHARQYSLLHDSVGADTLHIAVRRVPGGVVSNHLVDAVRAGARVRLVGPPETTGGLAQPTVPERALYLAGGVGITPMLSMLRRHARVSPDRQATLLYFNRTDASTLFADELRTLERESDGLRVAFFVDGPDDAPHRARLAESLLADQVPDLASHQIYLCGPEGFLSAARRHLIALGVPDDAIHEERFSALASSSELTGRVHEVRLARSGLRFVADEGQTLLEAAREAGIRLPSGCEQGVCRACVCQKRSGETVTRPVTDTDVHSGVGRITLCNTSPRTSVELDA